MLTTDEERKLRRGLNSDKVTHRLSVSENFVCERDRSIVMRSLILAQCKNFRIVVV